MIIRATAVATMDGPPIENGAVVVSGDRIVDVGKFSDLELQHSRQKIIDLGEQALLPGLINAHCHLDYTCLRGKIPRPKSFTEWIRSINTEKTKLSARDYVRSIEEGFAEARQFGTTAVANLTAFPELASKIDAPIRTWWFGELVDVRAPGRAAEIVNLAVDQLKSQKYWGLAPHAPFTASAKLFQQCAEVARCEDILLTTHLAESSGEMSMFRDAKGDLYDFLTELGRDMRDCGHTTPLKQFLGRDGSPNGPGSIEINHAYLLVHLNELEENDFDLLGKSRREFSVVHCPRSHAYFGHSPFQFEKLRKVGFNPCLGTDSLASNQNLSLFAEMRVFQMQFPDVATEEILKMVTVNAARALGQEASLGRIRTGFMADLIAVPLQKSRPLFDEIIGFERPVVWSMAGGQISA